MKSLIPLYGGLMLLAIALAGVAAVLLTDDAASRTAESAPGTVKAAPNRRSPKSTPPPAPPEREAVPELSAADLKAQDDADVRRILLTQIRETPPELSAEWLAELCQYIKDESSLKAYMDEILVRGEKFDAVYRAEQAESKMVMPADPRFYLDQARQLTYKDEPSARRIERRVPGLLAMGMYREFLRAERDWAAARDAVKITFYKESLHMYHTLSDLASKKGQDPRAWVKEIAQLHEAIIIGYYFQVQRQTKLARQQLKQGSSSGRPVQLRLGLWKKTLNENLLALGRLYVEAAAAETLYKRKQQEHAERAFKALAMVYQLTDSGEALGVLRESNRIQRYNLWKMAQATWKRARQAAESGDTDLADEQYFLAKRRYLQCLSRLEESKKKTVYAEYRRLQQEIYDYKNPRSSQTAEQVEEGA